MQLCICFNCLSVFRRQSNGVIQGKTCSGKRCAAVRLDDRYGSCLCSACKTVRIFRITGCGHEELLLFGFGLGFCFCLSLGLSLDLGFRLGCDLCFSSCFCLSRSFRPGCGFFLCFRLSSCQGFVRFGRFELFLFFYFLCEYSCRGYFLLRRYALCVYAAGQFFFKCDLCLRGKVIADCGFLHRDLSCVRSERKCALRTGSDGCNIEDHSACHLGILFIGHRLELSVFGNGNADLRKFKCSCIRIRGDQVHDDHTASHIDPAVLRHDLLQGILGIVIIGPECSIFIGIQIGDDKIFAAERITQLQRAVGQILQLLFNGFFNLGAVCGIFLLRICRADTLFGISRIGCREDRVRSDLLQIFVQILLKDTHAGVFTVL